MSEEKFLSEQEMLKMQSQQTEAELFNEKIARKKLEIDILRLQSQINTYKNELLKKQAEEMQREVQAEQEKKQNHSKEIKETNKQLANKYGLEEAWGYNPETGKIILQEKN